jgi:phospholipid N-methyltransferase
MSFNKENFIFNYGLETKNYTLCSDYLMQVAKACAEVDAGVQNVAFGCIDQLVHLAFQYIFFVFYPAYDRFYYERQVEAFQLRGKELPAYESWGFREAVLFVHRFIASPSSIGSIFPSSSALVNAITRKVSEAAANSEPQRYLEIGPGTGSFTDTIISKMKESDHLDLVEYDADLCAFLQRRYRHLKNVTIHHVSILDYQAEKYDVVVSGLPLMNFSPEFVNQAHDKYVKLTKDGGFFSYFEYKALPRIKLAFLSEKAAKDLAQVLSIKEVFEECFKGEAEDVWWNITPARVIHCQTP